MFPLEVCLTSVLVILLILLLYSKLWRPEGFPPGPFTFPVVGSLPFLHKESFQTYLKWKTKYGNLVGVRMGSFRSVIINDYKTGVELFSTDASMGKAPLPHQAYMSGPNCRGLSFTDGPTYSLQRSFAINQLKYFGFGKHSMEGLILDDIQELLKQLPNDPSIPIHIHKFFRTSVLRALWGIIASHHFDSSDPKFVRWVDQFSFGVNNIGFKGLPFFMPWLTRWFPRKTNFIVFKSAIDNIHEYLRHEIKNHLITHEPNAPKDFIDTYITKIKETKEPGSPFYEDVGIENLERTCLNFFGAGFETSSTILSWAMLQLALQPEIQEKLRTEIWDILGKKKEISFSDKSNMPYSDAVLNELLRTVPFFPFVVPHRTLEDMEFHGYHIPKDTMLLFNRWMIHYDNKIWKEPFKFIPERWMTKDYGDPTRANLITFGLGKRACPGEHFAKTTIYLNMVSIMQKYRVELLNPEKFEYLENPNKPGSPPFPYFEVTFQRLVA